MLPHFFYSPDAAAAALEMPGFDGPEAAVAVVETSFVDASWQQNFASVYNKTFEPRSCKFSILN
jgi:hypothetical protein